LHHKNALASQEDGIEAIHNLSKIDKEVGHSKRFIKVYLLLMRFPSRYLVQKSTIEKGEEGYAKKKEFKDIYAKVASRLEGIRRAAVKIASKKFYYDEELDVWIGVSENAMEVAQLNGYLVQRLNLSSGKLKNFRKR